MSLYFEVVSDMNEPPVYTFDGLLLHGLPRRSLAKTYGSKPRGLPTYLSGGLKNLSAYKFTQLYVH